MPTSARAGCRGGHGEVPMQYVKFWVRSVILLIPITFVVLYFGSHVVLYKVLWAVFIEAAAGMLTVIPLIAVFGQVDRSLWSDDEYAVRIARKRARIQELRRLREEEERREGRRP